jgi:hypothetical protein
LSSKYSNSFQLPLRTALTGVVVVVERLMENQIGYVEEAVEVLSSGARLIPCDRLF